MNNHKELKKRLAFRMKSEGIPVDLAYDYLKCLDQARTQALEDAAYIFRNLKMGENFYEKLQNLKDHE